MKQLRAGAGSAVITPPLGAHIAGYFEDRIAVDVHDDLYAHALVLESGEDVAAIVECDLIQLHLEDVNRARRLAQEQTGIPGRHILIAATHTHFGPDVTRGTNVIHGIDYLDWLPGRIADAVRIAQNRLVAAAVGHAVGQCPEECHNRRYLMKDGTVVTNPGYLNPEVVAPVGPTDPEVGLVAFVDNDLRPIAVLANYALHYVGGQHGAVGSLAAGMTPVDVSLTADYFGAFRRSLPRMAGAEFLAIMMNGCSGDINNIDVFRPAPDYPHPWYQIERVGDVVAAAAYKALRGIRTTDFVRHAKIAVASDDFEFRRREFTPSEIEAARRFAGGDTPKNLADRAWLESHAILSLSQQPLAWQTEIQALRVGEVAVVGLPGEIFVELGLEIKSKSPFPRTLTCELANDCLGYIPTPQAFENPSYEVYTTPASPATGPAMVASALSLLQRLADA